MAMRSLLVLIALWAAVPLPVRSAATFAGLTNCDLLCVPNRAVAVSDDGSTVVGHQENRFLPIEWVDGFKWNQADGFRILGTGGRFFVTAVSANGTYVVLNNLTAGFPDFQGIVSRAGPDGNVEIRGLGPSGRANGTGISGDGSVVVGFSSGAQGLEAFRWTQAQGTQALGSLGGAPFHSAARGISRDGQTIVGQSRSANGLEAFRWTQAQGMTGLGDLPGGAFQSEAIAASANGSVIVGAGTSASGKEAFIWTQANGMRGLGAFATGALFESGATAVSRDGVVVVGSSRTAPGNAGFQAFVWSEDKGMRRVADVLTAAGVDLTNWTLQEATGISGDANVIVGNGRGPVPNSNNVFRDFAWIARLGPQSGLTTLSSLVDSVANMHAVTLSGARAARADLGRTLDIARRGTTRTSFEPAEVAAEGSLSGIFSEPHRLEAYAAASGQSWNFDPQTQGTAPGLTAGAAIRLSPAWRIGGGVSAQRANDDTIFGGDYRTDGVGVHAFGSWNASGTGWRAFAAANYLHLEADIRRGYVNGAATASSQGDTSGYAATVIGRVEYAWPLNANTSIIPYLDYTWERTRFDAYSENATSGPFPASFDRQSHISQMARLGLEFEHRVSRATTTYGWAAVAKRTHGDSASVSGQFAGLGPFAVTNLRVPDDDWKELGVGLTYELSMRTRLIGNLSMATTGSSVAKNNSVTATVGLSVGF
jgi:probable HAF family extracellular repeat protein